MPCCAIASSSSAARAISTKPGIRPSRGSWARSFRIRLCLHSPAPKRSSISTPRTPRASRWHTDVTYVPAFPLFSVLRGVVIPPVGGDTVWANTVAAYYTLPAVLRGLADQLWALHSNAYDYGATRPDATARQVQLYETVFKSTVYETEHPVVQVHPLTGERTIILGYFARKLLGVSSAD